MNLQGDLLKPSAVRRLMQFWPQAILAASLTFVELLNVMNGMGWSGAETQLSGSLNSLGDSFSAVGGTTQIILGVLLVFSGVGLLWRSSSAWTMALLLLAIMLGIDVLRRDWGVSFVLEAVLFCALVFSKRRFTRRTLLARLLFSLSSILAVMAYAIFGSYLMGSGFDPPIRDLGTACYFATTTLSTVGFGDISPVTTETRWFVASLLVVGLGVFATAIASTIGPRISRELSRFLNPKEAKLEAHHHVILVGDGAIARNTALELQRRGDRLVRILPEGSDPGSEEDCIVGDATEDAVLKQAGILQAAMVIAAREDDGENAFISVIAKDLNPAVKVLAIASSANAIRRLKLARADLVFSPAAVGSRLVADLIGGGTVLPKSVI